jgi:hypothetical protein
LIISEIQELLDKYTTWLRDNTTLREVEDWVEITTPYLDRNNDSIQIYAKRDNGGYVLTDDAYTIEDLRISGCNIETPKRKELLKLTLNGFGVMLNKDALEVHTSKERFALQKHNLLQAILAVNDLFYLAEPIVKSLFLEDVTSWLDLSEVRYTSKVKFTGKTGYDHCFDFVIPKSKKQPERILQTINHPSRETAQAIAFSWIDTRDVRPPESRAYAFLNDSDKEITENVVDALKSYEVHPILWSKRDNIKEELAA